MTVIPLLNPKVQALGGFPGGNEFREIYNTLVQGYLSFLPSKLPLRNRAMLDRSLRQVALQSWLASRTTRPLKIPADRDRRAFDPDAEPQGNLIFDLPMRRIPSGSSMGAVKGRERAFQCSSSPPAASSSQPQTSVTSMRSSSHRSERSRTGVSTRSTQSQSSSSTAAPSEDPASQRLRALVSLTPQPALPTNLSSILAHWTVGADPADYNWAATQNAFAIDKEGDERTDASESRKSKRKKRLQQKSMEDWSASHPLRDRTALGGSQPTPAVLAGSQPTGMVDSSQTVATQDGGLVPMSQPVRGRFGMRTGKDVRKKKRVDGFR